MFRGAARCCSCQRSQPPSAGIPLLSADTQQAAHSEGCPSHSSTGQLIQPACTLACEHCVGGRSDSRSCQCIQVELPKRDGGGAQPMDTDDGEGADGDAGDDDVVAALDYRCIFHPRSSPLCSFVFSLWIWLQGCFTRSKQMPARFLSSRSLQLRLASWLPSCRLCRLTPSPFDALSRSGLSLAQKAMQSSAERDKTDANFRGGIEELATTLERTAPNLKVHCGFDLFGLSHPQVHAARREGAQCSAWRTAAPAADLAGSAPSLSTLRPSAGCSAAHSSGKLWTAAGSVPGQALQDHALAAW